MLSAVTFYEKMLHAISHLMCHVCYPNPAYRVSQTARAGGGRENYELDIKLHAAINPKVFEPSFDNTILVKRPRVEPFQPIH